MPQSNQQDNQLPSFNDRIADVIQKIIMAGGVAGGGLGAYTSLIADDGDTSKAILSAMIGLSITYGAYILKPLHKRAVEGSKWIGEEAAARIDWVTSQMIAAATGFEKKYLLCQASACQRSYPEGIVPYERVLTPLLKDVYVPLELDFSAMSPKLDDNVIELIPNEKGKQSFDIWKLLSKASHDLNFKQMTILAWGGYGKTTLLKHIAFMYGTKQQPAEAPSLIPVFLPLRNYRKIFLQKELPDLSQLITDLHIPSLPESKILQPSQNWAEDILKKGRAVIMFDGFDEIVEDQRVAVASWINRQMWSYRRSIFILTSRPKAYKNLSVENHIKTPTTLWISDFSPQQRKDFIEKWYRCQEYHYNIIPDTPDVEQVAINSASNLLRQIEARQELQDLAKNPLLLNMIATFHRRYPQGSKLPRRRIELYQAIFQLQLYDRLLSRIPDAPLTACDAQKILQYLAIGMMKNKEKSITYSQLIERLDEILKEQGETIQAEVFLDQIVHLSELVVQQENEYAFSHSSFQEFLAAVHIAQEQQEEILYSHFNDDWWKPTILFYAAKTRAPENLISVLMEREMADLAYECLQETRRQINDTLREEILTERYSTLKNLLRKKNWKEADKETYRLMVSAVGKEYGQLFEPEELINFPGEDLLIIDSLWVKLSSGVFGFSVQKGIYLSKNVGGIADGCYYAGAWNKFCHQVGWMDKGECIPVQFSASSPRGHLPVVGFEDCAGARLGKGVLACCYSLLSHKDLKCTPVQLN